MGFSAGLRRVSAYIPIPLFPINISPEFSACPVTAYIPVPEFPEIFIIPLFLLTPILLYIPADLSPLRFIVPKLLLSIFTSSWAKLCTIPPSPSSVPLTVIPLLISIPEFPISIFE